MVTAGTCPHPPDKSVLKTSVSADIHVRHRHVASTADEVAALQAKGYQVWGVETTERSRGLYEASAELAELRAEYQLAAEREGGEGEGGPAKPARPAKVAVVLGNEVAGCSPHVLDACDRLVEIPMHGAKNSLNVANCGAIIMYEVVRVLGAKEREREGA